MITRLLHFTTQQGTLKTHEQQHFLNVTTLRQLTLCVTLKIHNVTTVTTVV